MCIQDLISIITNIVIAISTTLAFFFAFRAFVLSKRVYRYQIVNDLYKEYRSVEMGTAIRKLYEYYDSVKENTDELIKKYKEDYNKEKDIEKSIHNYRRLISNFYQQMAVLADGDNFIKEQIYNGWKKDDLRIIKYILLPIELIALREILGKTPIKETDKYPRYAKKMINLYDDATE
jgi:hypothetical protein